MGDNLALCVEKIGKRYNSSHHFANRARNLATLRDAIGARFQRSHKGSPRLPQILAHQIFGLVDAIALGAKPGLSSGSCLA